MCGIGLHLLDCGFSQSDVSRLLDRRGPTIHSNKLYMNCMNLVGCVLHIQGDKVSSQPAEDEDGNVLLWNGEVFGGLPSSKSLHLNIPSDTECILNGLNSILKSITDDDLKYAGELIMRFLSAIDGPYAFIYIYKRFNLLFYGRDPFGRRSLVLIKKPTVLGDDEPDGNPPPSSIVGIVSVAPFLKDVSQNGNVPINRGFEFVELDIEGIYCINIENLVSKHVSDMECEEVLGTPVLYPWDNSRTRLKRCNSLGNNKCSDGTCSLTTSDSNSIVISPQALLYYDVLLQALRCRLDVLHSESPELAYVHPIEKMGALSPTISPLQAYYAGVLFSGGIDSVVLAAFLHLALEEKEANEGCKYAIDLINVSFYNSDTVDVDAATTSSINVDQIETNPTRMPPTSNKNISPDRIAAIVAYGELKRIFPHREWRLVHVDVSGEERQYHTPHIMSLICPSDTHMDLNIGTAFWFASRGVGYVCDYSAEEINETYINMKDDSGRPMLRIGVEDAAASVGLSAWKQEEKKKEKRLRQQAKRKLLKGAHRRGGDVSVKVVATTGLECGVSESGVIGNEAEDADVDGKDACLMPKCQRVAKGGCIYGMCKRCCIQKINEDTSDSANCLYCKSHKVSPRSVVHSDQTDNIKHLSRVMDTEEMHREYYSYESRVKVLLIGIGADEQMAGYGRHRTAFVRGGGTVINESGTDGYSELNRELNKDLARLWQRNLGRDDRCLSDHGREAWAPYLDENVVRYLQQLPLNEICDMELPPGEGDKKILRDVAKHIGLRDTSAFVKRAIQFGTRIAKQTNILFHGSNRKGSGASTI